MDVPPKQGGDLSAWFYTPPHLFGSDSGSHTCIYHSMPQLRVSHPSYFLLESKVSDIRHDDGVYFACYTCRMWVSLHIARASYSSRNDPRTRQNERSRELRNNAMRLSENNNKKYSSNEFDPQLIHRKEARSVTLFKVLIGIQLPFCLHQGLGEHFELVGGQISPGTFSRTIPKCQG
jgi:hypothetical protein